MKRSDYMLAALASAVLPNLGVAGVRENVQASATDEAKGIDQTVIQDASGKLYDVYATDTKEGRTRLIRRVKAAQTLAAAREPGGLGFDMDRVVAFAPGDVSRPGQTATAQAVGQQTQAESTPLTPRKPGPTGETTVMIAVHRDGPVSYTHLYRGLTRHDLHLRIGPTPDGLRVDDRVPGHAGRVHRGQQQLAGILICRHAGTSDVDNRTISCV